MQLSPVIALTIAGSDPSGGAGIQADLKTFHQFRVYGAAVITLITVQNTRRVSRVEPLDPALIAEQIDAVLEDLRPGAAKTGALGTEGAVEAVAARIFGCPLVVDPVLISTHGMPLASGGVRNAMITFLLPKAALVTPNLAEASQLSGIAVASLQDMKEAARRIANFGAAAVLVKGGHLANDAADSIDILYSKGVFTEFRSPRIRTRNTHGSGCTLAAAIAALLARGLSVEAAVETAKRFIAEAIRTAPGIGGGNGPVNHFADPGISL